MSVMSDEGGVGVIKPMRGARTSVIRTNSLLPKTHLAGPAQSRYRAGQADLEGAGCVGRRKKGGRGWRETGVVLVSKDVVG